MPPPFQLWFPFSDYAVSRVVTTAYLVAAAGPAHRSGYGDRVVLIAGMAALGLAMQWIWVTSFLGSAAPSVLYP